MATDVFEVYADDYDRWFDEHPDEYLAELSRIREVLPAQDSRSIEVGAGSGRFAAPLGIGLGIEPSRALGRIARGRGVGVIRGRVESLPIRTGSCSSVLSVTVICYLDDPVTAFREIFRVLLPGGYLVVAFIERDGQVHRRYLMEGGKGRFLSQARFYARAEVRGFLAETGFLVKDVDSRAGFCVVMAQKGRSKDQGRTCYQV